MIAHVIVWLQSRAIATMTNHTPASRCHNLVSHHYIPSCLQRFAENPSGASDIHTIYIERVSRLGFFAHGPLAFSLMLSIIASVLVSKSPQGSIEMPLPRFYFSYYKDNYSVPNALCVIHKSAYIVYI